jgi:branched-chain amino acid transport system substrate-binding protein
LHSARQPRKAACPVKIGGVLPLTGSMAPITKKIAQSPSSRSSTSTRAVGQGCPVQFILREDQGHLRWASTRRSTWSKWSACPHSPERFPRASRPIHRFGHGAIESRADHVLLDCEPVSRSTGAVALLLLPRSDEQDPGVRDRIGDHQARPEETAIIYVNTDFAPTCCASTRPVAKLGGEVAIEVPYNDKSTQLSR